MGYSSSSAENFTDSEKEPGSDVPPHVWAMIHEFLLGIKDPKLNLREAHLRPAVANIYAFIVFMYAVIMLTGLVFNLAVCGHILWNKLYNDATYSFIINNAISDVVKCVVVLPISLYVLMVQNWMLGELLCSFLPMLQYNNNKTVGRSDLSQICNMKLMDAQRTIENKDILIKMLQDQLKKIEGMYKENLSETEQFRYKYCVASDQLNQMQQENQKMPCRHMDQAEIDALKEEMLKLMKQQSSRNTEWMKIKERLEELGKMIVEKHKELNDKIENIPEQRYTRITHKTVIPGTKNDTELKEASVQVRQYADQSLEPARIADEVHQTHAPNVDQDFQASSVCVIKSVDTNQSSHYTESYVDDNFLMEQINIARNCLSQKFVPEYRVGLESESKVVKENNRRQSLAGIVPTEVHPQQVSNINSNEGFGPHGMRASVSLETIQNSSNSGSYADDNILMDQIRIARESLSQKADPESRTDAQQVIENDIPKQSVTEILGEPREERFIPRVSIDNRELFRKLTEEDRRSSLSSGAGGPKKRSVIFQGIPKESSSVELPNVDPSSQVHLALASSDLQSTVVAFRQLQNDVYQMQSSVQKLEAANRSCEQQIEKLNHVLSNQSQNQMFKFEANKILMQELLKENVIVRSELGCVKQTVEGLKRQSGEATPEFRSGDPLVSTLGSLDSDLTIDRVLYQIGNLFDEYTGQTQENSSFQIIGDNATFIRQGSASSSVGVMTSIPNAASIESEVTNKIHQHFEQIRNSIDHQGARIAERARGVENERLSKDLKNEHKNEFEGERKKEGTSGYKVAEKQDKQSIQSAEHVEDNLEPIHLWRGQADTISQIDTIVSLKSGTTTSSDSMRNLKYRVNLSGSQQLSGALIYENNVDMPSTSTADHQPQDRRESAREPSPSYAEQKDRPSSDKAGLELSGSQSVRPDDQSKRSTTATSPDEEYLQYYIEKVIEENGKLKTTINDLVESVRGQIDELNQDKADAKLKFPSTEIGKSDQYTQMKDVTKQFDSTLEDSKAQETVPVVPGDDKIGSSDGKRAAVSDCEVVRRKSSTADGKGTQKSSVLDTLESYNLYLQKQLLITKKIESDVQHLKGSIATDDEE